MRISASFIFFVVVAISGCSGITVSQDYAKDASFAALKTYQWKVEPDVKQAEESELSPLVATRIRNAIETELKNKGIAYDDNAPDFLIDYNLTVESKISSSNVGTTIGYGTGVILAGLLSVLLPISGNMMKARFLLISMLPLTTHSYGVASVRR